MARLKLFTMAGTLLAVIVLLAVASGAFRRDDISSRPGPEPLRRDGMVRIPGGTFRMGNEFSARFDQQPAHDVSVDPFWMDEHEVTNRQFHAFAAATGYRTTAEVRGWSHTFQRESGKWVRSDGADWRHSGGPDTGIGGREEHPAVHVSWRDAMAYAQWAGKRLPTEAQWEYAARSGWRDADFPWGHDEQMNDRYRANYRQHGKPDNADGHDGLAPVRSYPPSRFALYDMSGNAWEWCADWYATDYYHTCPRDNPPGPPEGEQRVLRGGSWLSPENFFCGHHVFTRSSRCPEDSYEHIGFRCVR